MISKYPLLLINAKSFLGYVFFSQACQKALVTYYEDEFHNFHLKIDDDNFALETNIDLGLIASEQRIIELDKGSESFGFHIKGGEKKKKATEQWLVFHYTTPIFISYIVPGGVADRCVLTDQFLASFSSQSVMSAINKEGLCEPLYYMSLICRI